MAHIEEANEALAQLNSEIASVQFIFNMNKLLESSKLDGAKFEVEMVCAKESDAIWQRALEDTLRCCFELKQQIKDEHIKVLEQQNEIKTLEGHIKKLKLYKQNLAMCNEKFSVLCMWLKSYTNLQNIAWQKVKDLEDLLEKMDENDVEIKAFLLKYQAQMIFTAKKCMSLKEKANKIRKLVKMNLK